jgi:hypothetical protein
MSSSFKVVFCWAGHLTFSETWCNYKCCPILHANAHPLVVHAVHDPAGHVLDSAGPPLCSPGFSVSNLYLFTHIQNVLRSQILGWMEESRHNVAVITTAGQGVLCRGYVSVSIGTSLYQLQPSHGTNI